MKTIICTLILTFLILSCSESKNDFTCKTYQETILRLQKENDSIKQSNTQLKNKLEKCDDWVNFIEEGEKSKRE